MVLTQFTTTCTANLDKVARDDIICTMTPYPYPDLYYSTLLGPSGTIGMRKTPGIWVFKPQHANDKERPQKLCDKTCEKLITNPHANATVGRNFVNYKHPTPLFNCMCSNGVFPEKIDGAYPLDLIEIDKDGLYNAADKTNRDDEFYEMNWPSFTKTNAGVVIVSNMIPIFSMVIMCFIF